MGRSEGAVCFWSHTQLVPWNYHYTSAKCQQGILQCLHCNIASSATTMSWKSATESWCNELSSNMRSMTFKNHARGELHLSAKLAAKPLNQWKTKSQWSACRSSSDDQWQIVIAASIISRRGSKRKIAPSAHSLSKPVENAFGEAPKNAQDLLSLSNNIFGWHRLACSNGFAWKRVNGVVGFHKCPQSVLGLRENGRLSLVIHGGLTSYSSAVPGEEPFPKHGANL